MTGPLGYRLPQVLGTAIELVQRYGSPIETLAAAKPPSPPSPHADKAPVIARALNRTRARQTASAWDRALDNGA